MELHFLLKKKNQQLPFQNVSCPADLIDGFFVFLFFVVFFFLRMGAKLGSGNAQFC